MDTHEAILLTVFKSPTDMFFKITFSTASKSLQQMALAVKQLTSNSRIPFGNNGLFISLIPDTIS